MTYKSCMSCKHCPENWREISQLPLCEHPNATRINGKPVWALYSKEKGGHCGGGLRNFEPNKEQQEAGRE